jgi:hypothetical protein
VTTHPRETSRTGPLQLLLGDAIDYAGLFPPAQLDMSGAVAEYASYLESAERWALGRFVVPVDRLDELTVAAEARDDAVTLGTRAAPWRLSVLLGNDLETGVTSVRAFAGAQDGVDRDWRARVEALEVRATTVEQVAAIGRLARGNDVEWFVEIPTATDPEPLVRALADAHLRAKVRTGGVTADAFPTAKQLARFLAACVAHRVPFKATAGLHHPLRGDYALTYAEGSGRATMFGFLNVFLATALLEDGAEEDAAVRLLDERDPRAVQFDPSGVSWRERRLTTNRLAAARRSGIVSFGSCSFREPIDDLESLGLL